MGNIDDATKHNLQSRARRAAGQAQAVARMIEDDCECVKVLTQISAARAALLSLAHVVIEQHLSSCVVSAFERGDAQDSIAEIGEVLKKFLR